MFGYNSIGKWRMDELLDVSRKIGAMPKLWFKFRLVKFRIKPLQHLINYLHFLHWDYSSNFFSA